MTSQIAIRMKQDQIKFFKRCFSVQYNIDKLVYFEKRQNWTDAYDREQQIKDGSRAKKIKLIESINPEWKDLKNLFCESKKGAQKLP